MDAPPPDQSRAGSALVSRRRLLWLAGSAGVGAATATACSTWTGTESAPASSSLTPSTTAPDSSPTASLQPGPPASTTITSTGASDIMLCRDAWGARPARPGGTTHTITRMTIHHSGEVLGDNRNITARLRQHQQYHQDQQGWIDIAYHVSVDRDGHIFELRRPELVGDTATDYDPTGHFLVLCEGNFDVEDVPEAQLHGAALTFAWAAQTFHIGSDTLASHRDFAATACPGANLYADVSSGGLKHRIDDLLAAGTVDLRTICGADAAAIVADIEAGR
ncbi:MAG: hypothetical protein QOE61_6520 [Micromonosporaceae bacterium]|nr:hypothetical protein [Micromonosporaceae bacterium]